MNMTTNLDVPMVCTLYQETPLKFTGVPVSAVAAAMLLCVFACMSRPTLRRTIAEG